MHTQITLDGAAIKIGGDELLEQGKMTLRRNADKPLAVLGRVRIFV